MRLLRAFGAGLILTALTVGLPSMLALTVGNPLDAWPALKVGDISDATLLSVLAAIAWFAWAYFVAALLVEGLTMARTRRRLGADAVLDLVNAKRSLPGAGTMARSLLLAVALGLPSLSSAVQLAAAHPASTTRSIQLTNPPSDTAHITFTTPNNAYSASPPSVGNHVAVSSSGRASSDVAISSALGVAVGVTLGEFGRLRRRQWQHRRPGRTIAPLPPALSRLQSALSGSGEIVLNDQDRRAILAALADTRDRPMPPARGSRPWDTLSDAAGAPLPHLTSPTTSNPRPALPSETPKITIDHTARIPAPGHYPAQAPSMPGDVPDDGSPDPADIDWAKTASTPQDLAHLEPVLPDHTRRLILDADPTLDDDLAQWDVITTPRPRLALLGPPTVRAQGTLNSARPRLAWHTEIVCYLAAHPDGVSSERLGSDLWPDDPDIASKSKLRNAAYDVRRWLGTDPRTGLDYLPHARTPTGIAHYQLEDLLTDAELFRRLRLRGVSRGDHGTHDLERALHLVKGPPLHAAYRRPDGYRWLYDTPIDVEYTIMIIDVAHIVATHHLAAGRPEQAAHAASIALTATEAPDDITLLDLISSCDARGLQAEADAWVNQLLAAHDAEVEEDLPVRTAEVLQRRRRHTAR